MDNKRGLLLCAILAVSLTRAAGNTYYVSPSGSDSAAGTSTGTTWANAPGMPNCASVCASTSLNPGDSVLLQSGGTWRQAWLLPTAGTLGSQITYGAYGTGALPIINAANLYTSGWTLNSGNVWKVSNSTQPQQVFFNGTIGVLVGSIGAVASPGNWFWSANVLYVYSTSSPATAFTSPGVEASTRTYGIRAVSLSYITIQNIETKYANQLFGSGGITIADSFSGVIVSGVRSDFNWGTGIELVDEVGGGTITNIVISNGQFDHNGESGIQAVPFSSGNSSSYTNISILNNQVHHNDQDTSTQFTAGIHVGTPPNFSAYAVISCLIQGNVSYLNGYNDAGAVVANVNSGPGIWLDTTFGCVATQNNVHQNTMQGIFVENGESNTVSYNVSWGHTNASTVWLLHPAGYALGDTSLTSLIAQSNLFVYNTSYGNTLGYTIFGGIPSTNTVQNNTVQNNISNGDMIAFAAYAGGENVIGSIGGGSGNIYTYDGLGSASSNFIGWGCTGACTAPSDLVYYSAYSPWETATGNCGTSGCSNSYQSSISFVNATAYDFRLPHGSGALTVSSTGGLIGALGVVNPSLITGQASLTGNASLK